MTNTTFAGMVKRRWYSLVDSLRTSLAQNGQNLEMDVEEVGRWWGFLKRIVNFGVFLVCSKKMRNSFAHRRNM
jgi:hypothetical protein